MISFLTVFILMALTGASSGLAVAWWYERYIRTTSTDDMNALLEQYGRALKENSDKSAEIAMQKGIAAGRECDAIQRKITDCLSQGRPVSVGFGGKEKAND